MSDEAWIGTMTIVVMYFTILVWYLGRLGRKVDSVVNRLDKIIRIFESEKMGDKRGVRK